MSAATTTWTATREDLVRELARARGERDAAVARMHAAQLTLATRRAEKLDQRAESRERYRQEGAREALQWDAEARRLIESGEITPDPLAPAHRKQLIDALKEKP